MPTVFIRTSGCSLRCGKTPGSKLWCDTPYALVKKGKTVSSLEAAQAVESFTKSPVQVLLTGGEPLESDKTDFCNSLIRILQKKHPDRIVRIETNGRENIRIIKNAVFSIDYKLPGSGMEKFMDPENFAHIRKRKNPLDEIKFVVRNKKDFDHSLVIVQKLRLEMQNLVYSPVFGQCRPDELAEWLKETGIPSARMSLQMHKLVWGNIRGV